MRDVSYLYEHYDEKIKRVKEINAPLNFIFYTDPHNRLSEWDCKKHPDFGPNDFEPTVEIIGSLQYIIDRIPNLQCVVCGGDLGCDYNTDPKEAHRSIEEAMEALYKLSVPTHCVIGNHDDCVVCPLLEGYGKDRMKEYALLPEDLHRICMKNNPTDKNYYYTDFDDLGYRFVFLNTSDFDYGFDANGKLYHPINVAVSRDQILWFKNEAVKTKNKVIVFSHSPISTFGHFPDCVRGYEGLTNGPWLWDEMKKAENVVASFSGHYHYDNVVYDGPVVAVSTDSANSLYHGQWDIHCPRREYGTYTETAFDVVSVTENAFYCTRFGAGADRVARNVRNYQTICKEWVK